MCDETYTCVCTSKCNTEICKTKCNGGVAFTFANEGKFFSAGARRVVLTEGGKAGIIRKKKEINRMKFVQFPLLGGNLIG